jgi:hypothetical protein
LARFLRRITTYPGPNSKLEEPAMQKKSLISTLKTTKKANVAAAPAKKEVTTRKAEMHRRMSKLR